MQRHRRAGLAILVVLVAIPALAQAQMPAGLDYLHAFVGKNPPDVKLWETEPLNTRLKALLGPEHATFLANMQTVGPLARYGDVVWTSGKAQEGGSDAALLLAETKADILEVHLLSKGKLAHRAERGAAIPLEGDAKTVMGNLRAAAKSP